MKAVCWMGANKMSVEEVPDPKILNVERSAPRFLLCNRKG